MSATATMTPPSAVAARGLDCVRGGRTVVAGLDLDIPRGSLVGLFGSNGSGKTTLLQTLSGIISPGAGDLQLLGGTPRNARTRIGYVAQSMPDGAFGGLGAGAFVGAAWRGERWGAGLFDARARHQAVERALADVGATHLTRRPMDALSGGERQRVCIAQALVNPVELLLLDEPLANLDPAAQQSVLALVARLCRANGLTVLLSAHDVNALLPVMDRMIYLAGGHGRIGTVDAIVNAEQLSALYGTPMRVLRQDGYVFIHPAQGFMPEGAVHCGHDHGHAHGHDHGAAA